MKHLFWNPIIPHIFEGTQLTLQQSKEILAGRSLRGIRKDDRQELLNYREALDFVAEYLGKKSEITEA